MGFVPFIFWYSTIHFLVFHNEWLGSLLSVLWVSMLMEELEAPVRGRTYQVCTSERRCLNRF